jgi:uncharacterized protein
MIDSEIDKIRKRLSEIENTIRADKTIARAKLNLRKKEQRLEDARKPVRKIEDAATSLRIKIETTENILYGGKGRNPKELQDLQGENESLKRRMAALEEELLEAMIELEQTEDDQKTAAKNLNQAEADFARQKAGLLGEHAQRREQENKLDQEREAFVASISQDNLRVYENLRVKKRGLAVVSIGDDSCSACGSNLRPELIQQAHSTSQMAACSTCGRILYAG